MKIKLWPLLLTSTLAFGTSFYTKPLNQTKTLKPKLINYDLAKDNKIIRFVWMNNKTVQVNLKPDNDECIYWGRFIDDKQSRVLITGCTDEEISIHIQSMVHGDTLAVGRNGEVEAVKRHKHLLAYDIIENKELFRTSRRKKRSYINNPDFWQFPVVSHFAKVNIPQKLYLPIRVYLSPSWIKKFASKSYGDAKKVLAHVKLFYNHHSLDTKFEITYRRQDFIKTDAEVEPTSRGLNNLSKYVSAPKKGSAAIVYLTAVDSGKLGIAVISSICSEDKKRALSITRWYKNTITTAQTVAHEIGHNLGFFHDFETQIETGRNHACGPGEWKGGIDNQLMNYAVPMDNSFSSCSNEDFQNYYKRVPSPFCLEGTDTKQDISFRNPTSLFSGLSVVRTVALPDGPKCEDLIGFTSVGEIECQEAARSLGYKGDLRIGSWSWAPYGCHAGKLDQDDQEYGGLYFNKQSGETGRSIYRTFCRLGSVGDDCWNQCGNNESFWCNYRRKVMGVVVRCADKFVSDSAMICGSKCVKRRGIYSCYSGELNEGRKLCGLFASDTTKRGLACVENCINGECRTSTEDSSTWDYCLPHVPGQVMAVQYASTGQECVEECGQHGEDYWWCRTVARWGVLVINFYSREITADKSWQFCSLDQFHTRMNTTCQDACLTRGEKYFWCHNDRDSWDYCSPPAPTLVAPLRAISGQLCTGVCDLFEEDYRYCTTGGWWEAQWWDYC